MNNGPSLLAWLFYGIIFIVIAIIMIASPVILLLSFSGVTGYESASDLWPFVFFTLIDLVLLFWWAHSDQKRMTLSVAAVIALLVAVLTPGCVKDLKEARICNEALAKIESSDYKETLDFLQEYSYASEYPSCTGLFYLCRAHIDYEEGNLKRADDDAFSYQYYTDPAFRTEKEDTFASTVRREYNDQQEKIEAEERAAESAYRNRISNGVPYVGMPESEIDNTSLGEHYGSPVFGELYKSGKTYNARKYGFEENGKIIFVAYCAEGEVLQVENKRYQSSTGANNFTPYTISTKSSASKSSYKSETYYDAEDFYDEYYDEFDSFEEAEDYFYDYVY